MLAVAALFTACGDDAAVNDQPSGADTAKIEINENVVSVSKAGGEYEITYTLTNPNKNNKLEAKCDVAWIHDFDYSIDGTVLFTVDANNTTESRIAYLYLEYGKANDKVTISQSGLGQEEVKYEFDIQYEIDGPYVTMNVSAEPENTRYYAWYMSKKGLEEGLAQSPGVDIVMYLNKIVEVDISNAIYYGAYAGYGTEDAVAELTFVGPSSQDFELNGETDFYGFVCPVSKVGERLADVQYKEFRTGAVKPSANVLTVKNVVVNTDRVDYTVATTNNDQYAAMVLPAADVEAMTDADLLVWFNNISDITLYLHFGTFSTTALRLNPNSDYYILVFGYEYGMLTTAVTREKIHTLEVDPTLKAEFAVTVNKVTNARIKCSVDAGDMRALYYADWCYADDNTAELLSDVREAAQWLVDEGTFPDLATAMKFAGYKGNREFDFTPLTPETDYRIFAVGIDETTGEFNTEVFISDVITTPAKQVSEVYIDIPVGKYFLDYDLKELYPEEFADADGYAVLPLDVTTHGDVAEYYYDVYTGDLTDTTYPTDEEIILDLEINGNKNVPLTMSYCYFDTTLTLIYFSKDTDDNFSPVTRKLFTLKSEGESPAEEFAYGAGLKSVVYKSSREL